MLSLISTGTPCRTPRVIPLERSASRAIATSRASALIAATAFSAMVVLGASIDAMRSRQLSTSSTDVREPLANCRAISSAGSIASRALDSCGSVMVKF
jgi:hypothetical protein